jgi:uncharacterized protein (DUF433 family)
MISTFNDQSSVIRTERGLTIAGTRITLYDVMDYVSAQYPPKFIRAMLSLTDEQIDAALSYIQTHRVAVETEYQAVLQESEELRRYWEEQNQELFAKIAAKPPNRGTEAIRAKLQVAKAKCESNV